MGRFEHKNQKSTAAIFQIFDESLLLLESKSAYIKAQMNPMQKKSVAPKLGIFRTLYIVLFRLDQRALELLKTSLRIGDIFSLALLRHRPVFLNRPEEIERVLVTEVEKFRKAFDIQVLRIIFGKGLLTREGEGWKEDRREIQSHFKPSFFDQFERYVKEEIERAFETHTSIGEKGIEAIAFTSHLTMRLILRKLIGRSLDDAEAEELLRHFDTAQMALTQLTFQAMGVPLPFSQAKHKLNAANEQIRRFVRKELQISSENEEDPKSLLSLFQKSGKARIPDPEERETWIIDQFMTFFAAGYETTAMSLTWLLRALALYPEVQEKCRGNEDYRAAVIQENFRLFPAIGMLAREATQEVELGGYAFEKGTSFLISAQALQQSPKLWKDPLVFRPERFLSGEETRASLKGKFMPFGLGPRICIGQGLATMEVGVLLRYLSEHFKVVPENRKKLEKIRGIMLVSVRPSAPVRLRLIPLSR